MMPATFAQAIDMLAEQRAVMLAARDRINEIEEHMAATLCPVKIGDVVESNGSSYAGIKMLVDSVRVSYNASWTKRKPITFAVCGPMYKKDGTLGARRLECFVDGVE